MFTVTLKIPDLDSSDPAEAARMFLADVAHARPLTLRVFDRDAGTFHDITVADFPPKPLAGSPEYLARFPEAARVHADQAYTDGFEDGVNSIGAEAAAFDPATLSDDDLSAATGEIGKRGAVVAVYDAAEFASRFDGADDDAVAEWFEAERGYLADALHECAYQFYLNNDGPSAD